MIKAETQEKILHFGFLFCVLTPRKTTLPGDVSLMLNMTHLSLRDPLRVAAIPVIKVGAALCQIRIIRITPY